MMRARLFLIVALPWFACVDEVDFDSGKANFPLVIDGIFSTDTATVRLSRGYPANGGYYATRVPNASVWISDVDDPMWQLSLAERKFEGEAGFWRYQTFNGTVYQAPGIVLPVAGHRYVLHVRVGADEFVSSPQRINEPGSIDTIYYTYAAGFDREANVDADGFNIFFDATVPEGEDRYFQWRMFGTFSVVADPLAGPFRCWATEREDEPVLSSAAHRTRYTGMMAKYVPITFDRFNDRYRVEIRQYEVSHEVWEFTEALRFQLKNASSLFQPPLAVQKGNITVVSGETEVIGIFAASIDSRRTIYIKRSDVPRGVFGQPLSANCLRVYPGSLAVQPPFWI